MLDELIDDLATHGVTVNDLTIGKEPDTSRSHMSILVTLPVGLPPGKIQEAMLSTLLEQAKKIF